MSKYIIRNRNGKISHEDTGQFAITTAARSNEMKLARSRREEELKKEMGAWAESMGIDPDDLRGLFA